MSDINKNIDIDNLDEKSLFYDHNVSFSKEELIKDIDEKSPCGHNVRERSSKQYDLYVKTKNLRSELRKQELTDLQESLSVIQAFKWVPIVDNCVTLLSKHTKDLEITSWFLEALARAYDIDGIIFGLHIFTLLLDKYKKALFPHPDEDEDDEDRLFSIAVLNGQRDVGSLVIVFYMMKICTSKDQDYQNLWQIKQ